MRLSVNQMRAIRECRLKRDQWIKKGFYVIHEYLGYVKFGVNEHKKRLHKNRFVEMNNG